MYIRFACNNQKGFVAILAVLTLMVISVSLVFSVSMLSADESKSSLSLAKSEAVFQLAAGCAEDVLLQSRLNIGYSGGTMMHPEGTCEVSISKDINIWTSTIQATDGIYTRNLQIVFSRDLLSVTVMSWKEI